MRLCINNYSLVNDKIQEIRFPFRMMNEAMDYSKAHKDKKIIMEIYDLNQDKMPEIDTLRSLQEQTGFFYDFFDFSNFVEYGKITEPFSEKDEFDKIHLWRHIMYHYPATTWAMVKICTYYKATDIMVGEPLVFQCDQLRYLRNLGFKIRANPHIGMNYALAQTGEDGLNHFWVLPQHMPLYDDYIDVFELDETDAQKEKSLINLYMSDFPYDLNLLIANYNCSEIIFGSNITEEYVKHRFNCGQRCLLPNGGCHFCFTPEYEKKLLHEYKKKDK